MRNFQILIVSAVKICKQCLQTASASGGLRPSDPLPAEVAINKSYKTAFQSTANHRQMYVFSYACMAFLLL